MNAKKKRSLEKNKDHKFLIAQGGLEKETTADTKTR